jgi:hypothetical protein
MKYKDTHPNQLIISHYIGSTAASSDLGRLLQRMMNEMRDFYPAITHPVPQVRVALLMLLLLMLLLLLLLVVVVRRCFSFSCFVIVIVIVFIAC